MKSILLFRWNTREKVRCLAMAALLLILFLPANTGATAAPRTQTPQPITLEMKQATIQQVLARLGETTRHEFFYRVEDLPRQPLRDYSFSNATIGQVMDRLLSGTDLEWTNNNGTVVIARKSSAAAPGEPVTVSGRVTDEDGKPLIGATIISDYTGRFATSDADGRFSIAGVPRNTDLSISYIGYEPAKRRVEGSGPMNVVMVGEVVEIENVVVTGYQTISKERAPGSFDIISGKTLDRPVTSADQLLVGQVAGLYMPQDANGNTTEMTIRGVGSWQNTSPLVVVDGFPYEGGLSSISPADIQSITVLKDAAAASIWGARAMHGVIVVSTKHARRNTPLNVEFSANVKVGAKVDVDYWRNMPSSAELIEYQKHIFGKYGYTPFASNVARNQLSNIYTRTNSQAEILYNKFSNGEISETDMNAGLARLSTLDNTDQIHRYILQQQLQQQYNLSFSGGTEKMTSYALFDFDNGQGIVRGSKSQSLGFTYRGQMTIARWLTLSVNAKVDYGKGKSPVVASNVRFDDRWPSTSPAALMGMAPYDMLLDENGNYTDLLHTQYYAPAIYGSVPTEKFPYEDWSYNPLREKRSSYTTSESLAATFQAGLKFRIIEGLTFDTQFRYYGGTYSSKAYNGEQSFTTRWLVNTKSTWTQEGGEDSIDPNLPVGGMLKQMRSTDKNYRWRNQINFDRRFGDHEITFAGGVEIADEQSSSNNSPQTYGYDDKYLTVGNLPNGTGSPKRLNNWLGNQFTIDYLNSFANSTYRYFSTYANLGYTYKGRYTLSGSFRTDAANYITDDPKDRYRPFWSVGAAWNITREGFMAQSPAWIDNINLRLTYGYNGNSEVGKTSSVPLVTLAGSPNPITGELQASIYSKGNPNLRWERTGVVNAGVDFALFGNKFFGKLDYYRKHGEDLLANVAIPLINGEREAMFNAAEMLNHGIEVTLGANLRIGNQVRWRGNLNFAYNYNKVLKYFRTEHPYWWLTGSGGSTWVEGKSMDAMYSYVYGGMRNVGTEASPIMAPVVMLQGDDYMPFTGSTTLDGKDFLAYQGVTRPPFTVGMTHTFSYRGLDLTFCFTGYFGHKFRRSSFNYAGQGNYPNKMWKDVMADNIDTDKVIPLPSDPTQDMWYSSVYSYLDILTESANNVRLQYLTLDYSLPQRVISRWGLERVTLYAQANNLLTIKATKEDPQYRYGTQRLQASYSFGLKVQF